MTSPGLEPKESVSRLFFKGETAKRTYDTLANVIGLVNSYITITYLSVFEFGLFQLLLAFIAILDSLNLDIFDGMVTVDMRRYWNAQKPDFAKRLFWENAVFKIGIAILMVAAVFGGSEIIALIYGQNVALFVKIVSTLLLARAIFIIEAGFLKSVMNFSHWSFPAIRETAKLLMIIGVLLLGDLNILAIVIAHVAAEVLSVGAITILVFAKVYRHHAGAVRAVKQPLFWNLFKIHGKWVTIRYAFSRVTKNAMPWFVKFFTNTEGVAYYSLAVNIVAFAENLMPMAGISTILLMKAGIREEIAFIFKRSVKYMFWLGVIFMIGGLLVLPPLVLWIFPKYGLALPVLSVMLLAFPLYGVYKVLKPTLTVLQEYKILALRIVREALVVPVAAVIFLPLLGVLGAGVVYNAVYWERTPFLYRKLIERYPDFKLQARELFRFDKTDYELVRKSWRQLLSVFRKK